MNVFACSKIHIVHVDIAVDAVLVRQKISVLGIAHVHQNGLSVGVGGGHEFSAGPFLHDVLLSDDSVFGAFLRNTPRIKTNVFSHYSREIRVSSTMENKKRLNLPEKSGMIAYIQR